MPWHAESGLEGSGSRQCYLWRVLITNLNVEVPFYGFKLETKSVHGRINAMAKPGEKKKGVIFTPFVCYVLLATAIVKYVS